MPNENRNGDEAADGEKDVAKKISLGILRLCNAGRRLTETVIEDQRAQKSENRNTYWISKTPLNGYEIGIIGNVVQI
jgi:hypothetical protein